jgi:hypothetical protein
MPSELASDPHSVEIPDDNGAVYTARGEVITLAVEAQACRVARSDGVGDVLRIVLK